MHVVVSYCTVIGYVYEVLQMLVYMYKITVEPVLKDHLIDHKNSLSRQVVFGDRFNCVGTWDLLPGLSGPSRQVGPHSSGLSKQVSLYILATPH